MHLILLAAVIGTLELGGEVPTAGGDYLIVDFEVPEGTVELEIAHASSSERNTLDFGVWGPDGFRGWGGGLTEPAVIGEADSSRGYLPGPITPGTWQLVIGKARILEEPAQYTANIVFRDAPTLTPRPRQAFENVVLEKGARWYKGDFHVHSRESGDASATYEEIRDLARSRGLDFVVLSEHNTVSGHGLQAAFQAQSKDVLFVRGNEVTTYAGHGNAVGSSAYVDHRIGLDGRSATDILADVTAQGALFIVNHPTLDLGDACIGCAWQHEDTPWDQVAAIEVVNGKREIALALFTPAALALWDAQLDAGHAIAPVGGSDDHRAGQDEGPTGSPLGSPTTLVWADELSEAALLRGLAEGRTIVQLAGPDDPLVELEAVAEGGGRAVIGETLEARTAELSARVQGGDGHRIALVTGGKEGPKEEVSGPDFTARWQLDAGEAGQRYRVHLYGTDGQLLVVTGHVWLAGGPAPADGGPGDGGDPGDADAGADGGPEDAGPRRDGGGGGGDAGGEEGGGCAVPGSGGAPAGPTAGAAALLAGLALLGQRLRRRKRRRG